MLTHGNMLSNALVLKDYWGWKQGRRADPRLADLPRARPVRGHPRRAAQRQQDDLALQVRSQARGAERLPEATVFMGVPTLYVRLLAEPGLTREACAQHAALRRGLGAPADRDLQRVEGAHRPHHPGALRHERNRHAHLQPLSRQGERAARRHRGLCAAGRAACACTTTTAQPCRHGEIGGIQVQGPERLRGLLAHAREDEGRVHRRRLLQDRRRRARSTGAATSSSWAAART